MLQENGVKVRGHVLVWHAQVNPSILQKILKHILVETVSDTDVLDEDCLVSREVFAGKVKNIWSIGVHLSEWVC